MDWLNTIVGWSLRNRVVVIFLTALLVVLGVRAAWLLPVDAMPDLTGVQVDVVTSAPALSPVEIEQYVTVPLERELAGTPGSTEIRSISKYGFSMVTVVFHDHVDIFRARQLVEERLRGAEESIATRYGRPRLGQVSTALGEIFQFVVRNDRLTAMQRRELLDWYIGPQLRTVPGVVDVSSLGGQSRQYQVVVDPKRVAAAGVAVPQVLEAIVNANGNAGGGYIESNREQLIIGTSGLVKSLDDLRRVVVIVTPTGIPVTVASIGEVRFGPRLRRGAASADADGEVVVGVTLMLRGENARAVTDAVKAKLTTIAHSLPQGTSIDAFYDRSILVDQTIRTVGRNLLEGAALVIVVLLLFLGSLRAGLVVAATIPLALLTAVVVMQATGLSGNLMSLGAIDFGLLVDGAVIIVENAMRRLGDAQAAAGRALTESERKGVIRDATSEVRAASIYGEVIIAVVYLPILGLVGIEGKLFRPLATTVLFALAGAVVLSLTLVPVLSSFALRVSTGVREPWLFRHAARVYGPALAFAERQRRWVLGAGVLAVAAAVALFAQLGADFVPRLDEGDLLLEVHRLPGVALSEGLAVDQRIERSLLGVPEVAHVVGRLGAPEYTTDPMGIDQTDFYVSFKPRASWRRKNKAEVVGEIAARLERDAPEVTVGVSQPIEMRTNEMLAGIRADIAAVVYGDDIDQLVSLGNRIAGILRRVPGAADVRVEQVAGLKYLRIVPDRAKLERYGVSVADINTLAETLAVGAWAGEVREGERRFGLVVKSALRFEGDLESLRALSVRSKSGQMVPLGDLADVGIESGPAEINRASYSRRLLVEVNVRGRDLAGVVGEAKRRVAEQGLPPGYRVEWGGQFQNYEAGRRRLLIVVPIALALILMVLWLAFRSVGVVLMIFLGVPFAIVGGVVALALRQIPFSISAGVGFIALSGVAILNGLVLVGAARRFQEAGSSALDAIRAAAHERLRPVLMTALVAALGFLPMAVSTAPGSEVQRPLATVVIGGMFSSPLLTLLILPVVFEAFVRRRGMES